MTSHAMIDIANLSHFAGAKAILSDVTWQIQAGEHWVLLGANGAGKTTLLKIICGYLWPNGGGRILRDGQERVDLPQLRRQIGWVTSQLAVQIPPGERVGDTVLSGRFAQIGLRRFPGMQPTADDEAAMLDTLQRLDCAEFVDRTFGTLSQGEQQKVLIARAYMARLRLLILDEPCAGLDPAARESLLEGLENLSHGPKAPSMLLVTHHVEEIMPAFTHTLALAAGRVIACGPSEQVIDKSLIGKLYGRAPRSLTHHDERYWLSW